MKFKSESLSLGAQKKKEKLEKKMSEEINFVRSGNVAHIGTEVKDVADSGKKTEDVLNTPVFGEKNEDDKSFKVSGRKMGSRTMKKIGEIFPGFLSKSKHLSSLSIKEQRNYYHTWQNRIENLKTMPESKKERNLRGQIREILHNPKNYSEPIKKNPMDVMGEDDLL